MCCPCLLRFISGLWSVPYFENNLWLYNILYFDFIPFIFYHFVFIFYFYFVKKITHKLELNVLSRKVVDEFADSFQILYLLVLTCFCGLKILINLMTIFSCSLIFSKHWTLYKSITFVEDNKMIAFSSWGQAGLLSLITFT